MDLDFGHGFIPRIGSQNYKAVDRCLGPDTLFDAPVTSRGRSSTLRGPRRTRSSSDRCATMGRRFCSTTPAGATGTRPTFEVATMAKASWAPRSRSRSPTAEAMGRYVRETLRCQAKSGAVPTSCPASCRTTSRKTFGPRTHTLDVDSRTFDELPPKPLVLFVGAHSSSLAMTHALLDELPGFLSGLYVQVGPSSPVVDSPTKLSG